MTAPDRPASGSSIGVYQTGGTAQVGTAIGTHHGPLPPPGPAPGPAAGQPPRAGADLGVITVLPQEMRAVVGVFRRARQYQSRQLSGGAQAHEAEFAVPGGVLRAVAVQALGPGQRSAVAAYHRLREHYAPPVVLLVGIAGAIRPDRLAIGDVVVSDAVIYYDSRREHAGGTARRGQTHPVAPVLQHRLNDFFQAQGGAALRGPESWFMVHRGPVGSGDAVVTDQGSEIRRWLRQFHEKTLVVETEAAGVAQAFYEEVQQAPELRGWLTVRGVSDHADAGKRHAHHDLAATHAALVLERLLPYLLLTGPGQ